MKPHLLITAASLLVWPSAQALAEDTQVKTLGFCELMNNAKLHSRQVVRVRAIFAQGAEQSVLYDPDCGNDKPTAAVEFGPRCKGATRKLDCRSKLERRYDRSWAAAPERNLMSDEDLRRLGETDRWIATGAVRSFGDSH